MQQKQKEIHRGMFEDLLPKFWNLKDNPSNPNNIFQSGIGINPETLKQFTILHAKQTRERKKAEETRKAGQMKKVELVKRMKKVKQVQSKDIILSDKHEHDKQSYKMPGIQTFD
jgi:hypothetical protein